MNDDTPGVEQLDGPLTQLNRQLTTLEELKEDLQLVASYHGTDVHVDVNDHEQRIIVYIRTEDVEPCMIRIARLTTSLRGKKEQPNKFEYRPEEETYVLKKTFRIDQ